MATIKTDRIIREICKDIGGLKHYNRILSFLLSGLKDLSLFVVPTFNQKVIQVNRFNAVQWPTDCVKPLAIGLERNGRIVALDVDDSIVPGDVSNQHISISNYEDDMNAFYAGQNEMRFSPLTVASETLGEWYGYEGVYSELGYVRHDKSSRQSHILGTVKDGDCVVMFYKSDGLEDCPTEIPSEAEMALTYFILHRHDLVSRPTVAQVHKENYKQEATRLRKFYQSVNESSWISAFRSNDKSTPK